MQNADNRDMEARSERLPLVDNPPQDRSACTNMQKVFFITVIIAVACLLGLGGWFLGSKISGLWDFEDSGDPPDLLPDLLPKP